MLSALILGAIVTIVGVRAVVHQLETTAHQIQLESRAAATLAAAVDDHEQLGHQILADAPVNREAFILQQREVSKLFDDTAGSCRRRTACSPPSVLAGRTGRRP